MDYELALQLENAGFPQGMGTPMILPNGDIVSVGWDGEGVESVSYKDGAYLPSLSELIEACGARMHYLEKLHDTSNQECFEQFGEHTHNYKGCLWQAGERNNAEYRKNSTLPKSGHGSTPEEAVARLWLAINKK